MALGCGSAWSEEGRRDGREVSAGQLRSVLTENAIEHSPPSRSPVGCYSSYGDPPPEASASSRVDSHPRVPNPWFRTGRTQGSGARRDMRTEEPRDALQNPFAQRNGMPGNRVEDEAVSLAKPGWVLACEESRRLGEDMEALAERLVSSEGTS